MAIGLTWYSSEAIADTTEGDHSGTLSIGTRAVDDIVVVMIGGIQRPLVAIRPQLTLGYGDDTSNDSFGPGIIVAVATGADTTTPITGATGGNNASNNNDPANGTLGAAPVSGDYSIAAINWDTLDSPGTKGVTPGSGWTEAVDLGSNDDYIQFQASYRTSSTSTTVDWPEHAVRARAIATRLVRDLRIIALQTSPAAGAAQPVRIR